MLFTLGALRKIQAGCMLIVSDVIVEGEFLRISDEDMRKAVDEMTELALHTVTAWGWARPSSSSTRRLRTGRPAVAGRRSPTRRPARGSRATRCSASAAGHLGELAREAAAGGARLLVVVGGDGSVNEVVNGLAGIDEPAGGRAHPARHGRRLRPHVRHPGRHRGRGAGGARPATRRTIDLGRVSYRSWDGSDGVGALRQRRERGHERRDRAARQRHLEGARREGLVSLGDVRRLRRVVGGRDAR